MRGYLYALVAFTGWASLAAPAHALCVYKNILYYETTLQEEFADAPFVVKAKVLSTHDDNKILTKDGDWGTYYRLEIEQVFKGNPSHILIDYTERNSGGFYLDVGKEYLLFLGPAPKGENAPSGTVMVNYSCGQSREWAKVSQKEQTKLADLIKFALWPK